MSDIYTARIRGGEIRYLKFGKGGENFVILPGLSVKSVLGSAKGIENAYSLFAKDYTVYLFDRVSEIPEDYRIERMSEDTAEAMRAAGIDRAHVFGTSQGGMIAQYLAAYHPELVKTLVLGSTASRLSESADELVGSWVAFAEKGDLGELAAQFGSRVYSRGFYNKYRDVIAMFLSDATEHDLKRFCILAGACHGFSIYDELDMIKCPVFVIGAGEDRVLGVQASRDIAEKLGCELYIYEDYGHAVYDEAPDYRKRVLSFVERYR